VFFRLFWTRVFLVTVLVFSGQGVRTRSLVHLFLCAFYLLLLHVLLSWLMVWSLGELLSSLDLELFSFVLSSRLSSELTSFFCSFLDSHLDGFVVFVHFIHHPPTYRQTLTRTDHQTTGTGSRSHTSNPRSRKSRQIGRPGACTGR